MIVAKTGVLSYIFSAWRVLAHATKPNPNEPMEGVVMANYSMPEIWRKVQDFPDYSVSNLGRVRRDTGGRGAKPGRILKPSKDANGYACVNLWRKNAQVKHYIHRLVALAFLGAAPSEAHHIAHWDGDGMNANVKNLRWATQSENEADKARHGRLNYVPKGSRTVKPEQLSYAKRRVSEGASVNRVAKELGFCWDTLNYALGTGIAPRKYWRHQ